MSADGAYPALQPHQPLTTANISKNLTQTTRGGEEREI